MDHNGSTAPLQKWNDTPVAFPQVCTHELFEQQAARTPEAVALVFGERRLSYSELNERANKVAHHLRKRGVGPDVLVGVCLERSPEMVISLLAVWKAGGAYVPLDPAYPPERLSFMIDDAQPRVVLTERKCQQLLFASAGDKSIYLDTDWPMIELEASENPLPVASPSDLAYVIYTSGSTGKPKGAMIVHSGLVNYLWWAIKAYALAPGCSVPVHTSLSFDLTVTSLYTPLLSGGTAELLAEDFAAQSLIAALNCAGDRGLVKITPAHLALLTQQISPEQAEGMARTFVIGGESLLAEHLWLWRGVDSPPKLINEYGPTETVVGCCVYEVKPEDPRVGPVPIGRPIANTQLYVLDEHLQPMPPGETGELHIGGAGVARGYLNRPQLTAERFLADPFSEIPGARLYKTGDLARRRMDGTLEYLGRIDDQVKIHGYRIELGEVEAALASQPQLKASTVVAREDDSRTKQLVAYIVMHKDAALSIDELRASLKKTLPAYMVPTRFVSLNDLPLTPNGKVDRKALPSPWMETTNVGKGGTPRSDMEKAVAAIWKEILNLDNVGIDEDFFDLGDSLNAIELVEQMEETFGVTINLASLFEQMTIAKLAELTDAFLLSNVAVGSTAAAVHQEFDL
jgi:amino acid adenylation domain-containing protein